MIFDEYRQKSERTLATGKYDYKLGLIGELGEITDIAKKFLYHGHTVERNKWRAELGDLCFYVAAEATVNGLYLEFGNRELLDLPTPCSLTDLCLEAARHIATYTTFIGLGLRAEAASLLVKVLGIIEELCKWFDNFSLTIGEVLQANIEKLLLRYPEGFSHEASLHRTA